ncbi:MAG TPA: ECF transporter S component [Bacillales bacterium]
MADSRFILGLTACGLLVFLLASVYFWPGHYLLWSLLFMALTTVPFVVRFELRKVEGRELVLLAVLAAVAAVSRIPFAPLPNVQPTTFVIIVAALVFGAESGFVIGAVAALVSNLFLGQGPWTPWQMYAWGMIGLAAGLLRNTRFMQTIWGRCVFGFIAGFVFDWIMNLWAVLAFDSFSWEKVLAFYATSFYFDLAHALSNVFFLAVFSAGWVKILIRFKKKYGLLG